MAFKGEIGAEFLDNVKTGFTVGDIYRIIDAGKLGGVDIPFGAFVEWKGTAWEVKKDMQYAVSKTGESLDQAVADVLDDHATGQVTQTTTMPTAEAAGYTIGNYFEQNGEIWKCTAKTDNGDGTWTVEAKKVNGVVPALNAFNRQIGSKAESNRVVAIMDASAYHSVQAGGKWYKVASKRVTAYLYNDNTIWDIYFSSATNKQKGCLSLCIRFENAGTTPVKRTFSLHCDEWSLDNNVKVVTRGVVGSVDIEIWVNANANYSSVMLVERNSSSYSASYTKGSWTYVNASGAGEYAPTTDADNNVYVYDANVVLRQPAVFDNYPTKNSTNLVNSGKLYNVFTDDSGDQMTETPPQQVYVTGKFYFVAGKVCRCTAYSAASATFDVYGVVEAMNYILGQT